MMVTLTRIISTSLSIPPSAKFEENNSGGGGGGTGKPGKLGQRKFVGKNGSLRRLVRSTDLRRLRCRQSRATRADMFGNNYMIQGNKSRETNSARFE